ncbi:metallophosphoesterase family protein [Flavobacterium rhizosphaerae]|uniref:Metallophosphoesterase n=1 Tax=Flavobacterium rhizosphaerae TaxID=3163298 RepID=A0ABW8YT98_9FLAO
MPIKKHKLLIQLALLFTVLAQNSLAQQPAPPGIQVAFLADVHLQDLYGSLSDNNYKGVLNPGTGKYTLLRTMESQMHSTRIFNENYFAFLAALDDIAKRGIKCVALPGDYTDDGQPLHLRGLQHILNQYSKKYGIQFFITTGNHDPVGPFAQDAGKDDFLGEDGKPQAIFSKADIFSQKENALPVIITKDIAKMGYLEITETLKNFGFYPQKTYQYWATPFSDYSPGDYSFKKATEQSALNHRRYEVAPGYTVPDASYLAEPVEGLWLLAIDGNVYIPKNTNASATDPKNYKGAGIGYNQVLTNKKYLISWVAQIAQQAKKYNKTLIAFSHYPMVDFNDDASPEIAQLMGPDKWQLERVPDEDVAQVFADAGIQIHFAGHMHINDTGIRTSKNGNTLINVQTPSLAAYIPAYKLLTIKPAGELEIETITIADVPRFDELFGLYRIEYDYLKQQGKKDIWNAELLKAENYREFTNMHLQELVRLRFIPDDWPTEFIKFMRQKNGKELLKYSCTVDIEELLELNGFNYKSFGEWPAYDMIVDFYRLRNADVLAIDDIGKQRIEEYLFLIDTFQYCNPPGSTDGKENRQLQLFFTIFQKFLSGAPANHFTFNTNTGQVKTITK